MSRRIWALPSKLEIQTSVTAPRVRAWLRRLKAIHSESGAKVGKVVVPSGGVLSTICFTFENVLVIRSTLAVHSSLLLKSSQLPSVLRAKAMRLGSPAQAGCTGLPPGVVRVASTAALSKVVSLSWPVSSDWPHSTCEPLGEMAWKPEALSGK